MADHDEAKRYLDAFASVHARSDTEVQGALARLKDRVAAGSADEPHAASSRRGRRWIAIGVAALLAAAVVVAVRGVSPSRRGAAPDDGGEPREQAGYGHEEQSTGGSAVVPPTREGSEQRERSPQEASIPAPPVESEQPVPRATEPKPKIRKPIAEPKTGNATLQAELALLRPAQAALRAGRHADALKNFEFHRRSFPDSLLAEECAMGRIEALCGLGRHDEARASLRAFDRAFADSPLRVRAVKACPQESAP